MLGVECVARAEWVTGGCNLMHWLNIIDIVGDLCVCSFDLQNRFEIKKKKIYLLCILSFTNKIVNYGIR